MRLHFGWWPHTWDYRLQLQWGFEPHPGEGCSHYRHSWRMIFMTWDEYRDIGLLALSPITFRTCRHLYGPYDADGVVPASTMRSETWTGRAFEVTHIMACAFGYRLLWRL